MLDFNDFHKVEDEMFCTVETLNADIHVLMIACINESTTVEVEHLGWILLDLSEKTEKLLSLIGDLHHIRQQVAIELNR